MSANTTSLRTSSLGSKPTQVPPGDDKRKHVPSSPARRRGPGICAIRGSCGQKGIFGAPLPCPDDGDAEPVDTHEEDGEEGGDEPFRDLLSKVCGPGWPVPDSVCCTRTQVETLRDSLQQAEPLISSCPACRNNFRAFYCSFTCSPDQSLFVNVTSTQKTDTGQDAVESLDYYVSDHFKRGFFNSCKDVQFGATNGFAMDLIGGGAKNASAFLKYMGDKRPGLGSPFQINFPEIPSTHSDLGEALKDRANPSDGPGDGIQPLDIAPLDCSANNLAARCTCVDCPKVCTTLPYIAPPRPPNSPVCTVGAVSCLTFSMLIIYSSLLLAGAFAYALSLSIKHRRKKSQRLALLSGNTQPEPPTIPPGTINPFSHHVQSQNPQTLPITSGSDSDPTVFQSRDISRHRSETNASSRGGDVASSNAPSRYRLGAGGVASLLDPIDQLQPRQSKVNIKLRAWFYKLGWHCATKPALTFSIASIIIALLNIGWKFFAVETDPVRLWVSPHSEAATQKQFFDKTFGPFYRPQQILIVGAPQSYDVNATGLPPPSPVLNYDTLDWWLQHERNIRELKSDTGVVLEDICFAPTGDACVVQSISAWLGYDMTDWDDDATSQLSWQQRVKICAAHPAECLPDFGQPIEAKFVLGGNADGYLRSKSLVATFVVQNSLDPEKLRKAEDWEKALDRYLADLSQRSVQEAGVKIVYSTGSSLEEELNKSTNTDVKIVVASYLLMFIYVSCTLGSGISTSFLFGPEGIITGIFHWVRHLGTKTERPNPAEGTSPSRKRRYMTSILPTLLSVNSKFMLGLFGIIIVLVAVSSSVGLFSLMGVRVTLIIAEVIPFLVLAVGVDNVFILVNELNRQNALHGIGSRSNIDDASVDEETDTPTHLSAEERVARTLARMGPSILLSALTEIVAFGLGALVPMPAVRNFALYAAGSVLLGAMLQMTVFVSAMTLDLKRTEDTRMDCLPCIRLRQPIGLYDVNPNPAAATDGVVSHFIRWHYAPYLLTDGIKQLVVAIFAGLFVVAIIGTQHITLGLDQRLALPSDSHLVDYFNAIDSYFEVGPPVYFVAQTPDIKRRSGQQALCGRFTTCDELSLVNVLEAERKRPESSFLSNPPAPWIDDFLHWTDPVLDTCCRVRKADPSVFCTSRDSDRLCRPCFEGSTWDITMRGLPEGPEAMRYLQQWLRTPTDDNCPLGGQAAYSSAVTLSRDNSSVVASHFRTYHTPLKTQEDFINALAAAKRISKDITRRTGVKVFPYSLFYVFFEQYAHIISVAVQVLLLALAAIFGVTSLLLGSWRTGGVVTVVCALALINVIGIMGYWSISLNALSLVNLVISLGIAVEFCSHIARSFMDAGQGLATMQPSSEKERSERAFSALVEVGPSVFSGITMTKLIGISVLALTRSKLLETYYFRMWLALIVSGALHGLVLLPVALSYLGGQGFALDESDEDWVASAMKRPSDYEYAPFNDDESVGSG